MFWEIVQPSKFADRVEDDNLRTQIGGVVTIEFRAQHRIKVLFPQQGNDLNTPVRVPRSDQQLQSGSFLEQLLEDPEQ